jgi:PAS domain S-box-containing protein
MNDRDKTKDQLIHELNEVRRRIAALEEREAEHQPSAEALSGAEADLRSITEQSPDYVMALDLQGNITFINRTLPDVHKDEVVGTSVSSHVPEELQTPLREVLDRVARTRQHERHEAEYTDPRGNVCAFEARVAPLLRDGNVVGFTVSSTDVTERKRTEEALKASEENYRQIFDAASDMIFVHDVETGRIVDLNRKVAATFGYSMEDAQQLTLETISSGEPPYTKDNAVRLVERAVRKGPQLLEWHCRRKNGDLFWVEVSLKPVVIGGVQRVLAVARDISERKRAAEALQKAHRHLEQRVEERTGDLLRVNEQLRRSIDEHRRTESELRALYEGVADGVLIADAETTEFVRANSTVCSLLGYSQDELLALSVRDIHPPDSLPEVLAQFEALRERRINWVTEIPCLRKDGSICYAEVSADQIVYQGRPCLVGFFHDITERRNAKELMRVQRDLSMSLNSVSSLHDALEMCCQTAMEVSGMDCSGVYLVNEKGGMDLAAYKGASAEFAASMAHQGPESMVAKKASAERPSFYPAEEASEANRDRLIAAGLHACAVLPVRHDGSLVACLVLASRSFDEVPVRAQDSLEAIAANIGGAIARIKAEEAVREGAEVARALIDAPTESAFLLETDGTIVSLNETAARRLGKTVPELIGENVYDFMPRDLAESRKAVGERIIRTGKSVLLEDERGGITFCSSVYPVFDSRGEVVRFAVSSLDITERKRLEGRLAAKETLLRNLLDLQERERKLLSHEIHDGFVQDIVGAQMFLEASCRNLETQGNDVSQELSAAQRLLRKGITEARRMISDLRPVIFGEQGLVEAIRRLASDEEKESSVRIDFEHDGELDRLDPILEGTVFRIAQEALTNVRRHSRSETAAVSLGKGDGLLVLEIRDQGVGFDPKGVSKDRFGLRGICERARLFSGRATIESAPGRGARIYVELPIVKWAPDDAKTAPANPG